MTRHTPEGDGEEGRAMSPNVTIKGVQYGPKKCHV
jgi:hypothetical protein